MYNIELEKSVLASLMSIEGLLESSGLVISKDIFYAGRHQVIFEAIQSLHGKKEAYDAVMVMDQLEKENRLNMAGGEEYLMDLLSSSPASKFTFESYVLRIKDFYKRRNVQLACNKAFDAVAEINIPVDQVINDVMSELNESNHNDGYSDSDQLCNDFFDLLYAKVNGTVPRRLETGFPELDKKLNLNPGDLMVIAGRPSMGKSTLAQNIMLYLVEKTRKTGVFFSAEMLRDTVMNRLISAVGSVNLSTLVTGGENNKGKINEYGHENKGEPTEEEWDGITNASVFIKNLPLVIDDKKKPTVSEIRSKLNKIKHDKGDIGVVVIDYLGLLGGINPNDRVNSIGDITREIKAIAGDFKCPVILLSQLNRSLENRPDKRPKPSDLRDSGAIEQDADQVVSIYRDEVYNDKSEAKGIAEIIVSKNRNGENGTIRLGFEGKFSRFTNLEINQ